MTDRSRPATWAPYMTWAKRHPPARYDLCGSNLLACTLDDLPGAGEVLALSHAHEEGYGPLLDAIARRYGTTADRVVTATGASGANFLALAALVRPGDTVLVEWPGYDPHIGAARLLGARVRTFRRILEDGFALDPDRVRAALTPDTRVVVVTNPHNPSGVLVDGPALDEIGRLAESVGARVLVDEVYLDALPGADTRPAATRGDVFVSTNSLTKSYGLSGLRCGWILADPTLTRRALRVRDVVDAVGPVPTERLATLAFSLIDRLLERARGLLGPNARALGALVAARPELSWAPPAEGASIGFPRLDGMDEAEPFVRFARERFEVGVIPGRLFGAPSHLRIAVSGDPLNLEQGLEALGRALDAWTARTTPAGAAGP